MIWNHLNQFCTVREDDLQLWKVTLKPLWIKLTSLLHPHLLYITIKRQTIPILGLTGLKRTQIIERLKEVRQYWITVHSEWIDWLIRNLLVKSQCLFSQSTTYKQNYHHICMYRCFNTKSKFLLIQCSPKQAALRSKILSLHIHIA